MVPWHLDASGKLDAALHDATSTLVDASSDASIDQQLAQRLIDKFRECAVIGEGEYHVRPVEDSFDRCMAECQLEASCTALKTTLCSAELKDDDLLACASACTNLPLDDGFQCGYAIPHSWLCDLEDDCQQGEDEVDCGTFACADGTSVASELVRCDGTEQCDDGSDEHGCAVKCPP
ncbi:MAG TPA: LDL receptor domain-containing protein [Polyangiales bacterium]|nr:LDL receptor domain-containing protein [Polyangiales bacterium]